MATKYTKLQTAEMALKALLKIPSQEIYPDYYISFHVKEKAEADCRYCVYGAIAVYNGVAVVNKQSKMFDYPGQGGCRFGVWQLGYNSEFLENLEDEAFKADLDLDAYSSAKDRHKIWQACVKYCRATITKEKKARAARRLALA